MTTEKRAGIVDLERLGTVIRAPSVTELHDILHGGRWFSGASIGHEYGFVCRAFPPPGVIVDWLAWLVQPEAEDLVERIRKETNTGRLAVMLLSSTRLKRN